MSQEQEKLKALFKTCDPSVVECFNAVISMLKVFGPYNWQVVQGSIHFKAKSLFMALHPLKSWLDVTLACPVAVNHPKLKKTKQVDRERYHLDFRFLKAVDIDESFRKLLKASYLN